MYDKNLIDVNIKDSIIYVHKLSSLLEDTTTYIKVLCHNDPNLTDSVSLHIKKRLELPQALENVNKNEKGVVKPAKHDSHLNSTKRTSGSNGITPSDNYQDEVTKIRKNKPN